MLRGEMGRAALRSKIQFARHSAGGRFGSVPSNDKREQFHTAPIAAFCADWPAAGGRDGSLRSMLANASGRYPGGHAVAGGMFNTD